MRAWWTRRGVLAAVGLLAIAMAVGTAGARAASTVDEPQKPDSLCALGQSGVSYGTAGADKLVGTAGADVICGLGGNDQIDGRGGADILDGGAGNDSLAGGEGNDRLYGEDGKDSLDGGTGDDGLFGGIGDDVLNGAFGNDGLVGGDGNDRLLGADGNDSLAGGDGNDSLTAAAGDDVLDGGEGSDSLDAASGTDICRNGETLAGCELGAKALDSMASPLALDPPPVAGPQTITVNGTFPGVSLTIDSAGGIHPWDVDITVARQYMGGRVSQVLAGPAFDISVPATAEPISSGRLTLPYDDRNLGGVPESGLRIWTFDEASQFWVPVPGAQTVDPATNTVTAPLSHLSVYAVLKLRTPDQWREIFGETPLRCAGDSSAGLDVVFLVDMSGSMGWNDPTNQRVAGARAFVEAMRPEDRAAVVGFDSSVYPLLTTLTALDSQANIDTVKAAIDQTGRAIGGTDISVAVDRAITILDANGGGGRLRVAVLLTDGVSPYDTSLTTRAANAAIEIHTVALGTDTDAALLESIAAGTGATFRQLNDPAQLPDLYRQLAGDIIGGGTDTDEDGLTDCVERNGMFVPISITFPFIGTIEGASFLTTDPEKADTDGDGLLDGQEVVAHDLASDPVLASTYDFLLQAGLTTYYTLVSDPTKKDTDGDGYDDGYELAHGMNPLVDDANELGIEGLDLPAFTLFQPSRYSQKPAVERRFQLTADGKAIEQIIYNSNPVRYDDGRNCVETCDAIRDLAEERPNDDGWHICVFGVGDCVSDESQMRDVVEEARVKQGVFDGDGNLDLIFLQEQVALLCAAWYQDAQHCFDEAPKVPFDDRNPDHLLEVLALGTIAIPAPGLANPQTVGRIADALAKTAAAVAAGFTAAQIAEAVRACIQGDALKVIGTQITLLRHPCEQLPMYSPGADVALASLHRVAAILASPRRVLEIYASPAERAARPFPRNWYIGQPGCTAADKAAAAARFQVLVSCDEFPNWAMDAAGPGASLQYMPANINTLEGVRLGQFYLACPSVSREVKAQRFPFLVIPVPVRPATVWTCGN